jgi:hypothetical protein
MGTDDKGLEGTFKDILFEVLYPLRVYLFSDIQFLWERFDFRQRYFFLSGCSKIAEGGLSKKRIHCLCYSLELLGVFVIFLPYTVRM